MRLLNVSSVLIGIPVEGALDGDSVGGIGTVGAGLTVGESVGMGEFVGMGDTVGTLLGAIDIVGT